jgi:transcription-repair coupling factor (superfamily II helicase)
MLDKAQEREKTKPETGGAMRGTAAIAALVAQDKPLIAAGVPEGFDAYLIARMAASAHKELNVAVGVMHVARDDQRMASLR